MSEERLKHDANYYPVLGGVTDDASKDIRQIRLDPTTDRLKVNTTITGGADPSDYAIRVAKDSGDSNVTYVGKATVGSSESSAVWQIEKIDETSGTAITFEDGDSSYDNKWSERESGSYS